MSDTGEQDSAYFSAHIKEVFEGYPTPIKPKPKGARCEKKGGTQHVEHVMHYNGVM